MLHGLGTRTLLFVVGSSIGTLVGFSPKKRARMYRAGSQTVQGRTLLWVKSSHSYANGNCVEIAALPNGAIGLRDSKNADGPFLCLTYEQWSGFLGGIRNGDFDCLVVPEQ
jgi:Domain of unknown function (DUF397)